ncbi:hypothetical protein L9F63_011512, partial [Diploptera punctata]
MRSHVATAYPGTADDDDCASVTTLDPKSREWLVCASQANYHSLAKLASENPRLAKLKQKIVVSYFLFNRHC